MRWTANNLSSDTLPLLLKILRITPPVHLADLSGETLVRLQNEARRLLRPGADTITELRCLAVLSHFSRLRLRLQKLSLHLPQDALRTSEDMFDSASVQQILGLLLRGAIATIGSSGSRTSLEQSTECLSLATEIARSIKAADKTAPAKHKGPLIQKLIEKLAAKGLDGDVRGEGLKLVFALSEESVVTDDVALILRRLLSDGSIQILEASTLGCIALKINQHHILELSKYSLILASQSQEVSSTTLHQIDGATHMLLILNSDPAIAQSISDLVWSMNSSDGFWPALEDFANIASTQDHINSKNSVQFSCPSIFSSAMRRLRQELRKLLLLTAFDSHFRSSSDASCGSVVNKLLTSALSTSDVRVSCKKTVSQVRLREDTAPCFQITRDRQPNTTSRNWRDILAEQSLKEADMRQNDIVNIVGQVCRDLEFRCEGIEEPLRIKEAEAQRLQEQLIIVQDNLKETERQLTDSRKTQHEAGRDFEAISSKLALSVSHVERLSDQLLQQNRRVEDLKQDVESTSISAAQAVRQADLKNMEVVQEKDRTREEKVEEIAMLRDEIQALNRVIEEKYLEVSTSRQVIADRDRFVSQLHADIGGMSSIISTLQATYESLHGELKNAKDERSELASARNTDIKKHSDAIAHTHILLNAANDQVLNLRTTLSCQEDLHREMRKNLETKICTLRDHNAELEQARIWSERTSKSEIDTLQSHLTKQAEIAQELRRCLGVCGPGAISGDAPVHQRILPTENRPKGRSHQLPNLNPVRTPKKSRKEVPRSGRAQHALKMADPQKSSKRSLHQPFRQPLADTLTAQNKGVSLPAIDTSWKSHQSPFDESPARLQLNVFSDADCESTRYSNSQIFASQVMQRQTSNVAGSNTSRFEVDADETRAD